MSGLRSVLCSTPQEVVTATRANTVQPVLSPTARPPRARRIGPATSQPVRTLDIGVDLDGCLYDFAADFALLLELRTGRPATTLPAPDRWSFHHQWGLTDSQFTHLLRTGIIRRELFVTQPPDPAGLRVLRGLHAAGHRLHVVTSRAVPGAEAQATESTRRWLLEHRVPHHSLNVLTGPKRHRAVQLGLDAAVDDAAHHYDELDDAGIEVHLLDRPWNRAHRGRRVRSWSQFAAEMHHLASRQVTSPLPDLPGCLDTATVYGP